NTDALWRVIRWIIPLAASAAILGCDSNAKPAPPPPPPVSVVEVKPGPVTVYDEFVGQTQAPDTIEMRSQVTRLLERKGFVDGARAQRRTEPRIHDTARCPRRLHQQLPGQAGCLSYGAADAAHDVVLERPDVGELHRERVQVPRSGEAAQTHSR